MSQQNPHGDAAAERQRREDSQSGMHPAPGSPAPTRRKTNPAQPTPPVSRIGGRPPAPAAGPGSGRVGGGPGGEDRANGASTASGTTEGTHDRGASGSGRNKRHAERDEHQSERVQAIPLETLQRHFPDFDALSVAEVVVPIYLARLDVEVIERRELPVMTAYLLKAVGLGCETLAEVAGLLGVPEHDWATAGAEALRLGLLRQVMTLATNSAPAPTTSAPPTPSASPASPTLPASLATLAAPSISTRRLQLTDLGQMALTRAGGVPVTRRRRCRLHVNALTGAVGPADDVVWTAERLVREGTFVLPTPEQVPPTLGDLTEGAVASALRGEPTFASATLVELLELQPPVPLYIPDTTVYTLRHRATGEIRMAVFHHQVYQAGESVVLQGLYERGVTVTPADSAAPEPGATPPPPSLPVADAQALRHLAATERALLHLEADLRIAGDADQRATPGAAVPATVPPAANQDVSMPAANNGAEEAAQRVAELKAELHIKRQELDELRTRLRVAVQVEFLRTEEHRAVLARAFAEAQQQIVIISPWMTPRACNADFCQWAVAALHRGVRLRIGYGLGSPRDRQERDRNAANVYNVKRALRTAIPPALLEGFDLRQTLGTHQKILVCDTAWAVTGSFNWLSYMGLRDDQYRNETGALFRHPEQVADLLATAREVLDAAIPDAL